jgi:hypothetical protein
MSAFENFFVMFWVGLLTWVFWWLIKPLVGENPIVKRFIVLVLFCIGSAVAAEALQLLQ